MVKGKDSGPEPDDAWKDKTSAQAIPPGAEEVPHDATAVSELPFDATDPMRPLEEEPPPRRSALRKAAEPEPRASAVVKRERAEPTSRRQPRLDPEPPARPSQVRRAAERPASAGRTGVELDSTREIRIPDEEEFERRKPDFSSTQPVPPERNPAPDFSSTRPLAVADPPRKPDFSSTQPLAAGRAAAPAPKDETRILAIPRDDATPPPRSLVDRDDATPPPRSLVDRDDATPPPRSLVDRDATPPPRSLADRDATPPPRSLIDRDDATPPPRSLLDRDDSTPAPSILPPARPGASASGARPGASAKAGAFSLGVGAPKTEKPPEPPLPKASVRARLAQFLAGAAGVLVLALVVWAATRDRPPTPFLERAYPYGYQGMTGPHGEQAPPVSAVTFRYEGPATCTGFEVCLRYSFASPGFAGEMRVGKKDDGQWVRANDEGLPFRPTR